MEFTTNKTENEKTEKNATTVKELNAVQEIE